MRNQNTKMMPLSDMYVDTLDLGGYQRDPQQRPKVIAQIVQEWDPIKAGHLLVNVRDDGRVFVIDGAGRREAMLHLGIGEWMCDVYTGLSQQQEADIFHSVNAVRRALHTFTKFNARVMAGHEDACAILHIVTTNGFQLMPANSSPTYISAVDTLSEIYDRFGALELEATLGLVKRVWPQDIDARKGVFLYGIALFRFLYPESQFHRLWSSQATERKLSLTSAADILKYGRIQKDMYGGSLHHNVAKALYLTYNKGRRSQMLPDLFTKQAPRKKS